jgi:hypothetical protein
MRDTARPDPRNHVCALAVVEQVNAAVRPGRRIGEPDHPEQSGPLDERRSQFGAHPRLPGSGQLPFRML